VVEWWGALSKEGEKLGRWKATIGFPRFRLIQRLFTPVLAFALVSNKRLPARQSSFSLPPPSPPAPSRLHLPPLFLPPTRERAKTGSGSASTSKRPRREHRKGTDSREVGSDAGQSVILLILLIGLCGQAYFFFGIYSDPFLSCKVGLPPRMT